MSYVDIEERITMQDLKDFSKIIVEGWETESPSSEATEVEITYRIHPSNNTAHEVRKWALEHEDMDWHIEEDEIPLSRVLEYVNSFIKHMYTRNSRYFVIGEKKNTTLKSHKTTVPKINFRKML